MISRSVISSSSVASGQALTSIRASEWMPFESMWPRVMHSQRSPVAFSSVSRTLSRLKVASCTEPLELVRKVGAYISTLTPSAMPRARRTRRAASGGFFTNRSLRG